MHQNAFGGKALPVPAGGSLQCSPRPHSWVKGGGEGREVEKRKGEGGGGGKEGKEGPPQCLK